MKKMILDLVVNTHTGNEKPKDIQLEVTVDYSTAPSGLYIIFLNQETSCGLLNDKTSEPYNEVEIRRIMYCVSCSFKYAGGSCNLLLGFYNCIFNKTISYVILSQELNNIQDLSFGVGDIYVDETVFTDFYLLDYIQLLEQQEIFGKQKFSLKEAVQAIVSGKLQKSDFKLYQLPKKGEELNDAQFVDEKAFTDFLDEEEKK